MEIITINLKSEAINLQYQEDGAYNEWDGYGEYREDSEYEDEGV